MASISKQKNSNKYRVTFSINKRQKEVALPTGDERKARYISAMIDKLIERNLTGLSDPDLSRWLASIPDDLQERLEKTGLIEQRMERKTLSDLLDSVKKKPGKPATKINRERCFKYLFEFVSSELPVVSFTREMADDFCVFIRKRNKAGESAERPISMLKNYFRDAQKMRWITENPFEYCKILPKISTREVCRITEADTVKVLDNCPNKKWRAIIALMRLCGLRGANELKYFDWSIDSIRWSTADSIATITLKPTKQEHIEKRKERIVPLPPLAEKCLLDWLQESRAEENPNFPKSAVFPDIVKIMLDQEKRGVKQEVNLNTVIKKIFNRSSVPISTSYDLRKNCCSDWLTPDENGNTIDIMIYEQMAGHSLEVGRKYYQQLFPDRLSKGLESVAKRWNRELDSNVPHENPHESPLNSPLQDGVINCKEKQNFPQVLINTGYMQRKMAFCNNVQNAIVPPAGLEPVTH